MNVGAGNVLDAGLVDKGHEKEGMGMGKGVEVDLEEARSRGQTPGKDGGDSPLEPVISRGDELPFSKAGLIALVVTLTGAAFLNVSISSLLF